LHHTQLSTKHHEGVILAAIYARTSSPNQRFNYSIEEQVNQCWSYCRKRGWVVRYVFIDECESGSTVERPKFQLMLEKAKAGEFKVITFWKLDRFCRSLADLVNIERTLRQCQVELCSVTEFVDTTTSVGRFNYRNLASVAELERELIGERARLGLYALARQHKWPNDHPPLGYEKDENGKLVVNPNEVKLVQRIFEMYTTERSMPQVAFKVNAEGVLTKRKGKWNPRAVRGVLTNSIYIGRYRVAGVETCVEEYRIVPDDLFKKVRETMLRYRTSRTNRLPMPETRRKAKVEVLFNRYQEFLHELELEGLA